MKIQTNNRLAHYQVEYTELQERLNLLNGQEYNVMNEINQYNTYLGYNNGDRLARQSCRSANQRLRSIRSEKMRIARRLNTLTRQMQIEQNKIRYGR